MALHYPKTLISILEEAETTELLLVALSDEWPAAYADGRMEKWRIAAHSIIDLLCSASASVGCEPLDRRP